MKRGKKAIRAVPNYKITCVRKKSSNFLRRSQLKMMDYSIGTKAQGRRVGGTNANRLLMDMDSKLLTKIRWYFLAVNMSELQSLVFEN